MALQISRFESLTNMSSELKAGFVAMYKIFRWRITGDLLAAFLFANKTKMVIAPLRQIFARFNGIFRDIYENGRLTTYANYRLMQYAITPLGKKQYELLPAGQMLQKGLVRLYTFLYPENIELLRNNPMKAFQKVTKILRLMYLWFMFAIFIDADTHILPQEEFYKMLGKFIDIEHFLDSREQFLAQGIIRTTTDQKYQVYIALTDVGVQIKMLLSTMASQIPPYESRV